MQTAQAPRPHPAAAAERGTLDGVALQFEETMSGPIGLGETDPARGAAAGDAAGTALRFEVRIRVDDLGRFLRVPEHEARLTGNVTCEALGGTFAIKDGRFNLFRIEGQSGVRQMTYRFAFTGGDGQGYFVAGHKDLRDDPGELDVVDDMTTLFTTVHRGDGASAPVHAAGLLRFRLADLPALVASMRVENTTGLWQQVSAYVAFTSFAYGVLRDEYIQRRLVYDTRYENLVVSGRLRRADATEAPFFLVSGVHDRGFPWGDGELFSDLLLAVGDGAGGYERYCVSDRVLDGLRLDATMGTYRYEGPVFRIRDGFAASYSQMRAGAEHLVPMEAAIELAFDAQPHDAIQVSFPLVPKLVRKLSSALARELREHLAGENPLGIYITPHSVTVKAGSLALRPAGEAPGSAAPLSVVPERTAGEAELGTFRNVKEPTLLYGYLCAIRPERRAARVQIHSRTLRDERQRYAKDRLDAFLGAVVSRTSSSELLVEDGAVRVRAMAPAGRPGDRAPPIVKLGDPVIEVNDDHFRTAVFQRRIVEVRDPSGERCLALEEDMSRARLEAMRCERKVTVASIEDEDRLRALDRVLDATGFDALVRSKLEASRKSPAEFAIAIKPNFMFSYDRRDPSTYTDPALVGHLVSRLRRLGLSALKVVEAQSTYGEYFDRRSVREMAEYLGYDGKAGYQVVDLTLDVDGTRYFGPHLGEHPVSRAWRDADFRISFAKNKTHAYAYYTLSLKNVYGALPLANKFKEYHCRRGIFATAIEFLRAFPLDYALVDAFLSADGPFGVFADPGPNETRTVIGGADPVAVDWIGATRMGIDPMLSPYMKLAVEAFGKPEIRLVGTASPYRPWLNVPAALALFANEAVDADYTFGNLMYSAAAQMDETHFRHKDRSLGMRALRKLTVPLRRAFFVRTGEDPSAANRFFSWLFYKMGY